MTDICPECGNELKEGNPPRSVMGELMYGRGLEEYYCDNPKCPRFYD